MFSVVEEEEDELVTNCDRFQPLKHSSIMPRAFTEQGVAMLSSVLKSERAIEVKEPKGRYGKKTRKKQVEGMNNGIRQRQG